MLSFTKKQRFFLCLYLIKCNKSIDLDTRSQGDNSWISNDIPKISLKL